MSRELQQPFSLFPPGLGLYKPFRAYNAIGARGFLSSALLWRVSKTVLSIAEGQVALESMADDNAGAKVTFITTYNHAGGNSVVMFYLYGGSLRLLDLATADSDLELHADISNSAVDPNQRVAHAFFRNRLLIATYYNGLWWVDPETNAVRKAGVPVPSTAAALADGGAGVLTAGDYRGVFTFVNDQGHESNPSASASVTLGASKKIAWTSIDVGPTGTAKRRLYRTTQDGATYLFLAEIADNTTTTYDDNNPDASLGSAAPSLNTIPPEAIRSIAVNESRVALLNATGNLVSFCLIDATTGLPNWEAYPVSLELALSIPSPHATLAAQDSAQAIFFALGDWYVFAGRQVVRLVGDIATGMQVETVLTDMGVAAPYAVVFVSSRNAFVFVNNLNQLVMWQPGSAPVQIAENVYGILEAHERLNASYTIQPFPHIEQDPVHDAVYVNLSEEGLPTADRCIGVDLKTGAAYEPGYLAHIMHFSPFMRCLYGINGGQPHILGWYPADVRVPRYWAGQLEPATEDNVVQWFPFTPAPGHDIYFRGIVILARAMPRNAESPVILAVEYALDGSDRFVRKTFVLDQRLKLPQPGEAPTAMTLNVDVSQVARTITVRLVAIKTGGLFKYGCEVYSVGIDAVDLNGADESLMERSAGVGQTTHQ